MKQQQLVGSSGKWVVAAAVVLVMALSPSVTFGGFGIVDPVEDNGTWGFEIGNGRLGRQLIRNKAGKYYVNVPSRWEAGLYKKFTEIIAPLNEGTPRSRLEINVSGAEGVSTPSELLQRKDDWREWSRVEVAGLSGIKRKITEAEEEENTIPELEKVEIELLRGGELMYITISGKKNQASLEQLYRSVLSIQHE